MKHYPDLLLLFALLSVTTMIKAQISIRPYSEWEATQFVAVNGHQPEDYVKPDNNWEILYNLRTPRTQAELREMGIKCSDSQLLLLEVGGLVSKTDQYLQPIITQYFIDNKSEIWLLFLIAHSKR